MLFKKDVLFDFHIQLGYIVKYLNNTSPMDDKVRENYLKWINNTVDQHDNTVWYYIITSHRENIVQILQYLLRHKVLDPNQENASNNDGTFTTPLNAAARAGNLEIVLLLCSYVNRDKKDEYDKTPLTFAIEYGHTNIVEFLLGGDAVNVNNKDNYGNTPLHYAVKYNRIEIVKMLIEHDNIKVDKKNNAGKTPLGLALITYNQNIFDILISKVDLTIVNSRKKTPLHIATKLGCSGHRHYEMLYFIEKLLAQRANVHAQDEDGETPLHDATKRNEGAVMKMLLEAGAPVDVQNGSGNTPLHIAIGIHNTKNAELLIAKNTNVNTINEKGETPLHTAVGHRNAVIVKLLLMKSAQPDAKNADDRTSLEMITLDNGHSPWGTVQEKYSITEMLLLCNCDTGFLTVQLLETLDENMKLLFKNHYITLIRENPGMNWLPREIFERIIDSIMSVDIYNYLCIADVLFPK